MSARLLRPPANPAGAVVGDREARAQRAVGADRSAIATTQAAPLPLSRPPADREPRRAGGHRVVFKTGINWNRLPTNLVGSSGVTCWRPLRDWTEVGVWPELHELLLAELRAAGELDLDRCAVDGPHVRALKGGSTSARR